MVQVKGYLTLIMWNMKTNELFNLYNNALKKRLLPEPTNREVLRKIIKEIGICVN